jgi:hypothetical protein
MSWYINGSGKSIVLEAITGSTMGCRCSSTSGVEFVFGKFEKALDGAVAEWFTDRVAAGNCAVTDVSAAVADWEILERALKDMEVTGAGSVAVVSDAFC